MSVLFDDFLDLQVDVALTLLVVGDSGKLIEGVFFFALELAFGDLDDGAVGELSRLGELVFGIAHLIQFLLHLALTIRTCYIADCGSPLKLHSPQIKQGPATTFT